VPLPHVAPHLYAWCPDCSEDVPAVQWWKNPRKPKIGKYRSQYQYRCPQQRLQDQYQRGGQPLPVGVGVNPC
jgi:hypothetical protein